MPTVSIVQRLETHGVDLEMIYGQETEGTVPRSVHLDEPWARRITNRCLRVGKTELVRQPCLHQTMRADLVVVEQANRLSLNDYRRLVATEQRVRRCHAPFTRLADHAASRITPF